MIRRLIEWRITAVERTLGVPADYLRHLVRVTVPSFLKFATTLLLSSYRL